MRAPKGPRTQMDRIFLFTATKGLRALLCTAALLCMAAQASCAGGPATARMRLDNTLVETQALFFKWIEHQGYSVLRQEQIGQGLSISCDDGMGGFEAEITPYTALGSAITFRCQKASRCQELRRMAKAFFQKKSAKAAPVFSISGLDLAEAPDAVKQYLDNTVCIHITGPQGVLQCSGLFIQALNKVISTAHNIGAVDRICLSGGNGYSFGGRLLHLDRDRDLALIEVEGQIPPGLVPPKRDGLPSEGERIYFVGCPLDQGKILISGKVEGLRNMKGQLLIQARIHVEPGASGSPVYDSRGRLIGLIKGRLRGNKYQGFIIPMSTVEEFLDDILINHKKRPEK